MSEPSQNPVFHHEKFLEMLSHNREVANMVVKTFIEQSNQLLADIQNANQNNNLDILISSFHKLAGSASSISAITFGKRCKAIELELEYFQDSGESQNPWIDPEDLQEVEAEYKKLHSELQAFLQED